jgi:hypothetical protein
VTVSLSDRRLWVILNDDTLLNTPVAVAMGETLEYQGHRYTFAMPRGVRTVLRKTADPIWVPPEWFYVETAADYNLKVAPMRAGVTPIGDGRQLSVRDSLVGLIDADGEWSALPPDEHIVFNHTLYIPPAATINRRISGSLGNYALDLGEGFLLHGTPLKNSIGQAVTHGCVRLRDEDIAWIYEHVPVGTKVYVY